MKTLNKGGRALEALPRVLGIGLHSLIGSLISGFACWGPTLKALKRIVCVFKGSHADCSSRQCALTVLGELDELSSSSGESSSSSGSVGMAGGSEGRERVWGKKKGWSAGRGESQDSLEQGPLWPRGDPRPRSFASSSASSFCSSSASSSRSSCSCSAKSTTQVDKRVSSCSHHAENNSLTSQQEKKYCVPLLIYKGHI